MKKTILISSDHAGFEMKQTLVSCVRELGYDVIDIGPQTFDPTDDYPDTIAPLAQKISQNPDTYMGIVLGHSGQGEAMMCNRFAHVRAVVLCHYDEEIIELSRQHNDANVLSIGAQFLTDVQAKRAVEIWLSTDFSHEDRHIRRIAELDTLHTDTPA